MGETESEVYERNDEVSARNAGHVFIEITPISGSTERTATPAFKHSGPSNDHGAVPSRRRRDDCRRSADH